MSDRTFDAGRFADLVHYICARVSSPSELGATKLNKALWISDLVSYLNRGQSITGHRYIKLQHGPVPKFADLKQALAKLAADQKLLVRESEHFGFKKREYIVIEQPVDGLFPQEEKDLIDFAVHEACVNNTAKSISKWSHNDIWDMANIGEELPHETIFAAVLGEINEADVNWAQEKIARIALAA